MTRPTVALDIDGTLAAYSGWRGPQTPIGEPLPGAHAFLNDLRNAGYDLVVHSARPAVDVDRWLRYHGMTMPVPTGKPGATVFLDDRAVRFLGDYARALRDIEAARNPWWKVGSR